ncbi:MAG: diacylglycerol kinase family protein [Chloroflexi bacterium]|nr:diacylglycerol kinase family protein [Chloroflexota bacterium]
MNRAISAFAHGFVFALHGIRYALRTQRNMRVHLLIAAAVVLAGVALALSSLQWAIIALTMALVLSLEMINTVVESVVDLVSPAHHPLAKTAKDVAAGAVLIAALFAVVIGALIFGPRVLR